MLEDFAFHGTLLQRIHFDIEDQKLLIYFERFEDEIENYIMYLLSFENILKLEFPIKLSVESEVEIYDIDFKSENDVFIVNGVLLLGHGEPSIEFEIEAKNVSLNTISPENMENK